VLATALYARQLGISVDAVVFPQPLTDHVREQILADVAAGARLHAVRGYLGVPLQLLLAQRGAFFIATGGSSTTGTLGYVSAACEISEQIQSGQLPKPDVVYLPVGSCGTAAGLVAGLPADIQVVGVRVVARPVGNRLITEALARATLRRLKQRGRPKITIDH